jgi:branched-chain amino acid transport system substrate-binding protein
MWLLARCGTVQLPWVGFVVPSPRFGMTCSNYKGECTVKLSSGSISKGIAALSTLLIAAMGLPSTASASSSASTASVKTITVAGLGALSEFSGAATGAEARFKRFNDTNEIPGVRIKFVGFDDDQQSPATALSDSRQLVNQDHVFAIVPDLSAVDPGPYLAASKIVHIGGGYDSSYCSSSKTTSLWGFGVYGCQVSSDSPVAVDYYGQLYKYVSVKTGKKTPTVAIFGGDTQSAKTAVTQEASAAQGAGFKVVFAKGDLPNVTSDYSPYIQQWITSNEGKPPNAISCLDAATCVSIWPPLKAAGYSGTFESPLGPVDLLQKTMAGTVTLASFNTAPNPGLAKMQADLNAYAPGTKPVGYSNVLAYFSADMFIQALKKAGKKITPQSVQKALSTSTWGIPNLVGPVKYPASTVSPTPSCNELVQYNPSGSGYTILEPYTCSLRKFRVNPKFG